MDAAPRQSVIRDVEKRGSTTAELTSLPVLRLNAVLVHLVRKSLLIEVSTCSLGMPSRGDILGDASMPTGILLPSEQISSMLV